jgi:excisionase family DNA binding protein
VKVLYSRCFASGSVAEMSVSPRRSAVGQRTGTPLRPVTDEELTTGQSVLDELLTSAQVAAILQMKVSTIEDYARRGVLPSVKLGRHRRFIRSQLERALSALTEGQS